MKNKNIFLDRNFLHNISPNIFGLAIGIIIILILASVTLALSTTSVSEILIHNKKQLLVFSVIFGTIAIVVFVVSLFTRGTNALLSPIVPISSYKHIKVHINNENKDYRKIALYPNLGIIAVAFFFFFLPFILGAQWSDALLTAIAAILPFHLGFIIFYIVLNGLEVIVLIIRYFYSTK